MLAIVSINGARPEIQPLIDGFSVTSSDLLSDKSGRSAETGLSLRYLVRANVKKLTLKFKGTVEEIEKVNRLTSEFEQRVIFLDGTSYVTKNMYPGDRNVTTNGITAELTVNLIEI